MRYSIIFIFFFLSCASIQPFQSDIPFEIQEVFTGVKDRMEYDKTSPKWSINPMHEGLFGLDKHRHGSCSNYVVEFQFILVNEYGYSDNQFRRIFERINGKPHVKLLVKKDGKEYILDNRKKFVYEVSN